MFSDLSPPSPKLASCYIMVVFTFCGPLAERVETLSRENRNLENGNTANTTYKVNIAFVPTVVCHKVNTLSLLGQHNI